MNKFSDKAFGYVHGNVQLLLHHDPMQVQDGSEHDTVNLALLSFALRNIDLIPIFEDNPDEVRASIKEHLEGHKNALASVFSDMQKELEGFMSKVAKDFNNSGVMADSTTIMADGEKIVDKAQTMPSEDIQAQDPPPPSHSPDGTQAAQTEAAKWDRKFINDLPDAAFAVIEKGGEKDEDGKTKPRSYRHLPHHNKNVKSATENSSVDLPHLRNGLARANQVKAESPDDNSERLRSSAERHLRAHAKALLSESSTWAQEGELLGAKAKLIETVKEGSIEFVTVLLGEEEWPFRLFFEMHYDSEGKLLGIICNNFSMPAEIIPDVIKFLKSLPQ